MQLAKAEIVRGLEDPAGVMRFLETVGRICHDSGPSRDAESADKFIRMLVRLGHTSVLEHVDVTVRVECDRAMAMQWTRHRLASYTMESQRYVKYDDGVLFIDPEARKSSQQSEILLRSACDDAQERYQGLLQAGWPAEDARAVLPNCTKTVFYTTANLRSWMHFFEMRCAPGAQHNIRRVALELLKQMADKLPAVFQTS